jgi:hypothetical protein
MRWYFENKIEALKTSITVVNKPGDNNKSDNAETTCSFEIDSSNFTP